MSRPVSVAARDRAARTLLRSLREDVAATKDLHKNDPTWSASDSMGIAAGQVVHALTQSGMTDVESKGLLDALHIDNICRENAAEIARRTAAA